ncbi:MAG: AtpZ/AtpI family protein [Bacillota bacterium]
MGNWSVAFTAGLTILAGMAIGYYGGRYLDRLLGTEPWLALVGSMLGVAAGFRVLIRDILPRDILPGEGKRGRDGEDDDEGDGKPERG